MTMFRKAFPEPGRRGRVGFAIVMGLLVCGGYARAAELRIQRSEPGGTRIDYVGPADSVAVVEKSEDLREWREWLRLHDSAGGLADLTGGEAPMAFYRALVRSRTNLDDWKNVVEGHPEERFLSEPPSSPEASARWIKFALLLDEPSRVYFQDSSRYEFHYDFARVRIPRFQGMTRAAFDTVTLRTNAQEAVLGTVLVPTRANVREIGVQFVGMDEYPRERIAEWFGYVRAAVQAPSGVSFWYLPTFEQARLARDEAAWLASQGVQVGSAGQWAAGDECYSPGWALGRMVEVEASGIAEAYRSGRLRPDDILLTDGVPAEVPPLAGIITTSPATPNSHVALLAQSFGIPFVYMQDPVMAEQVRAWSDRDVAVRAVPRFAGCQVVVAPVEGELPAAMRAEILALKTPPVLNLPAKGRRGRISVSAEGLAPADVVHVGGKAANFGILRRRIPAQSPQPAMAFTFDLWDEYLDTVMRDGRVLRQAIADRLRPFAWPPDMAALGDALAEVREWIQDETDFSAARKQEILGVLAEAGFPAGRKIRFRSSTNVEDGEQFSGAGLYDSYSGCVEDDLDGDGAGPSHCDSTEAKERGVFRALRKVYASFYNSNAFLERLRHRVDESQVGMAVLVHPSTPDAEEEANGVATLQVSKTDTRYLTGELVTQLGAVSVTNPDLTALPEVVTVSQFGASAFFNLKTRSSLVPLGATVLEWDREYRQLLGLLNSVALGYEAEFPGKREMTLDFEFKRQAPNGVLSVKQVREVPVLPERSYTPWLIGTPLVWEVFQGEHGDVVSFHRLKSRWRLPVRHTSLAEAQLAEGVYLGLASEWREGTNRVGFDAAPPALPAYAFERRNDGLHDRWSWESGEGTRHYDLRTSRIVTTDSREGPLVTLGDHFLEVTVRYATPQPSLVYSDLGSGWGHGTVQEESVRLVPASAVGPGSLLQHRTWGAKGGRLTVRSSFWWPAPPTGPTAGYTAPLQAWVETVIEGLVSRPIVLRGEWAQTYHPGHHNFYEEFLFEPRLDPSVPADLLAELDAANIRAIVVAGEPWGTTASGVWLWGVDGRFRAF